MFTGLGLWRAFLVSMEPVKGIAIATIKYQQSLENISLYSWNLVLIIAISMAIGMFSPQIYQYASRLIAYTLAMKTSIFTGIKLRKETSDITLDEAMKMAGYAYDPKQDIFYSKVDAWQRDMGYCRLYDEAAAPLGMIMDCEPIYFEYDNRRWLIEFWKGQYGMTTGCEIGVYATTRPDLYINDFFNGTFYDCVEDQDLLQMSFAVQKKGKTLFIRRATHWWLTGFMLGEFSEPSELTMYLSINLKDKMMCNAFVKGLKDAGYLQDEIMINRNKVRIKFDEPRTIQPMTRTKLTDWITQRKNKLLCDQYQEMTRGHGNSLDRIKAIQKQAPEVFERALNIGKTKQLFDLYEKIKKYLT